MMLLLRGVITAWSPPNSRLVLQGPDPDYSPAPMLERTLDDAVDAGDNDNDDDDDTRGSGSATNFIPNSAPVYDYCNANFPSRFMYTPVQNGRLVHLQLVIRHGDRTPQWKTSPSDAKLTWDCTNPFTHQANKCVAGSLTKQGFEQHEHLGKNLRDLYIEQLKLLPPTLTDSSLLLVRSTSTDRTKQSAYALLYGLFPPQARTVQSIPVRIRPKDRESIVAPEKCRRRLALYNRMTKSKRFLSIVPNPALKDILHKTMPEAPTARYVTYADQLNARACHKLPMPCNGARCANEKVRHDIHALVETQQTYLLRDAKESTEATRLGYGVLMSEIWDGMRAAMEIDRTGKYGSAKNEQANEGKDARDKFRLFSGHDDTIYGLLGLMKAVDSHWPPYAANIVYELWDVNKKYKVRILYNGIPLKTREWDFGQGAMEVKKFKSWLRNKIVSDIDFECE